MRTEASTLNPKCLQPAKLMAILALISRRKYSDILLSIQPPTEVFEVDIVYNGVESLEFRNPLVILIGDITQHSGPGDWGEFTVISEGLHALPLDKVSRLDNDSFSSSRQIHHNGNFFRRW